MYALYHEAENEYVGIHTWSNCESTFVSLERFSQLDGDDSTLFVTQSKERAQSLIDIARTIYSDVVPLDACVDDFMCDIKNLAEYRVVKIGIVPE